MIRRDLGRAAFSVAVALALGFGAREALGSSPAVAGRAERMQYCADQIDCENWCAARYPGQETAGVCNSNLCFCYRV